MAYRPGNSQAVPIFKSQSDRSFKLDVEALKRVLLADHVKNKPVVVISVAGAFRKGKSFLLNFFIRYLANQCRSNWLNDCDATVDGFTWRGGTERETTGILLWSEVFVVATPRGEVAVVLMDTQGTFDRKSTMEESATIFALSTMLSSVQIYNLSQNIGEDDLQHLQLFCDYGQLVIKVCVLRQGECTKGCLYHTLSPPLPQEVSNAPFQKLMFLVRDWSSAHEYNYGEQGGRRFLKKFLQVDDDQPPELRRLRQDIKSSFEDITCFLMPHPGLKVARDPEFKGCMSDIESKFRHCLQELVSSFLHGNTLEPKRDNGVNTTCAKLCANVQVYAEAFKKGEVPAPTSMREAIGVANNVNALVDAMEIYTKQMNKLCGSASTLSEEEISSGHEEHRRTALETFDAVPKLGGRDLEQLYRQKLLEVMNETFKEFEKRNNQKSFKGMAAEIFKDILLTVGIGMLTAPFKPAMAIGKFFKGLTRLSGYGLSLASNILGDMLGTAVAPCDGGAVAHTLPDELCRLHLKAIEQPPTHKDTSGEK